MSTLTAGQKADVTNVIAALTDRYSNPKKDAIRKWVIAELKAAEPALVLDLWGGGRSAAEMTAAGLPVLSVDDGRDGLKHKPSIKAYRTKRALAEAGEVGGYRTGWSTSDASLLRYLSECDAAWLDFMGHPCHTTERVLAACKGKKIVVLTLMASRLAGHEGMSVASYIEMYKGLICGLSGLTVRSVRKYSRQDKQWVLVLLARAAGRGVVRRGYPEYEALKHARATARRVDPEFCAKDAARSAANRAARPGARAAYFMAYHAAYRATHREEIAAAQRARRADPEYRRARSVQGCAYRARKKAERTEGATA